MIDYSYNKLLSNIMEKGFDYEDPNRKGKYRRQIPHKVISEDLTYNIPVLTTKYVHFPSAVGEFLTFMRGDNTLNGLENNGVKFWRKDAFRYYEELYPEDRILKLLERGRKFALGKIYPYQMRTWNGKIDQIEQLVHTLKTNPMATKKIVTMWNPSDLNDMALSPCHYSFEALVEPIEDKEHEYGLTIKWSQASVDVFLGLPFNIVYYSLMCYFLSQLCNMKPLRVIGDLTNVHIYHDHFDAVKEQMSRDISKFPPPSFRFSDFAIEVISRMGLSSLDVLTVKDFELVGYEHQGKIKAEMLTYSE